MPLGGYAAAAAGGCHGVAVKLHTACVVVDVCGTECDLRMSNVCRSLLSSLLWRQLDHLRWSVCVWWLVTNTYGAQLVYS